MAPQSLEKRVEILEIHVEDLRGLPARVAGVEGQIVLLRTEMRDGFSATRAEMNERFADVHSQMHALHDDAISRIADVHTQMLVLHEDVIARISLLGEGQVGRARKLRAHPKGSRKRR